MRDTLKRSFSLLLLTGVGLMGCLRDGSAPIPRNGLVPPANLNAAANTNSDEPAFGNTLNNIRKISQKPYNGTLRFMVLGDNRNSSPISTGGNKIYAKVIDTINQFKPDFAINLGDFTFDALKPHWNTFERLTSKVQVPYLTVIGNHDMLFGRSYYESRYTHPNGDTGLDDYSFDYGNSRFIIIDSANYNLTDRQFQWMERQLQTPLKKFVFTHTPPRYGVWEHKLAPTPEVSARFMGLNEKYHTDYVFLGHIHLYDQRVINGVPYMVSGGAGAPLDGKKDYGQSAYHVGLIEVTGSQVIQRMVPIQTRIITSGPTSVSNNLEAQQMTPEVLKQFPPDYIPVEEQANDR
jgi:serine/threonine-protein phosphatase CPPED1